MTCSVWIQHTLRTLAVAAVAVAMLAMTATAQGTGASVTGNVSDPSGATIPAATVTAKNIGTGAVRTVTTDGHGAYSLPNLQPGAYSFTYTANGFETQVHSGLTLTVGEALQVNAVLKLGSSSQTVQVTAAAPAVQLTSSTVNQTVDSQTIRQLPLNGRSWTDLATLSPGVANPQDQPPFNGGRGQRGFGAQISISGRRPEDNNYRIDGISVEDYQQGGPGNVQGGALGVDAVQEFSVLTGTYSAQFGMSTGGVINAITRSGTNDFHGSLYEFLRNSSLDAANYFDTWETPGGTTPPLNRNQFGGSAGGPLFKNKTFIFGDFEAIREIQSLSNSYVVPSAAARAGNLSSGTVTPDAYAEKFLNAFYPLPNGTVTGDTGIFSHPGRQINHENFFIGRMDQHLSQNDTLSGTLEYDKNALTSPDEFNEKLGTYGVQHELYTLQETHIFGPTLLNSARVGIYRTPAQVGVTAGLTSAANDTSTYSSVPGRAAPDVKISGLKEFTGGVGAPSFYNFHYTTIQFFDDLNQTVGNHNLTYGVSAERIRDNLTAGTDANGVYNYGSFAQFLTNAAPKSYTAQEQGVSGGITGRSVRQTVLGTYVQDDWRFSSRLTVNMGVRYEFASIPTETHGDLSILPSLDAAQDRCGRVIAPYCSATPGAYFLSNPTKYDFEPRLGLAWDPTGHGTTAVRAGFGIYDTLPLPYLYNLEYVFTSPYFQLGVNTAPPAGSFAPASSPSDAYNTIASNSNTLRNAYQDPYAKRSYVMQYDLNVQHQFGTAWALMVGYIGDGGVHEPFRSEEVNGVVPADPNNLVWPTGTTPANRVNPNQGVIRGLMWEGKSNYNALETQLTRRMSGGVQMSVSYTWSHDIDDGTSPVAGDTFANSIPGLFWFNLRADRGNSDLNVGQTFVYNALWQLPQGKGLPTLARLAVGGWQLGGILNMHSGVPFTVTLGSGGDPLGQFSAHSWDTPNMNLSAPGCGGSPYLSGSPYYLNQKCFSVPSPINVRGNTGRNEFTGPDYYDVDMSLVKNFPTHFINESSNVEFRVGAFNLLNHPNLNPPVDNTDVFDDAGAPVSSGGLIDSTAGTSRQLQFGLKLTW